MASGVRSIDLPNEVWHFIFEGLSSVELRQMGLVNRELYSFVLDYLQKNFPIPHQIMPEGPIPLGEIFQAVEKTGEADERLALIDAGNQTISRLWKHRGYDRAKLPPFPPYLPVEFEELQRSALSEEIQISLDEQALDKIIQMRTQGPCFHYFLTRIYPQLSGSDREKFCEGIAEGVQRNMDQAGRIGWALIHEAPENALQRVISGAIEGDAECLEITKNAVVLYLISKRYSLWGDLQGLYSCLSEGAKTTLRWEIFLQNGESLRYGGVDRVDLGQFVIDGSGSARLKLRVQTAALACRELMNLKRWERLNPSEKLYTFFFLAKRAVKMPSQGWLIKELIQKFTTITPTAQILEVYAILKERENLI